LGYLTYTQAGKWLAGSYNPDEPLRIGEPHDITEAQMQLERWGSQRISLSQDGSIAFIQRISMEYKNLQLVWVDFEGNVENLDFDAMSIGNVRISPNGNSVLAALDGSDINRGTWILDLERGSRRPFDTHKFGSQGVWMPDGTKIVTNSNSDTGNLSIKATDFRSEAVKLDSGLPAKFYPHSISSDGKWLAAAYTGAEAESSVDIGIIALDGSVPIRKIPYTSAREDYPSISPDGKWITYTSNETGKLEIYIVPFSGEGHNVLVSADGGEKSIWSNDGKTIYYQNGRSMMAIDFESNPELKVGIPRKLFEGDFFSARGRDFDLDPTQDRFLMLIEVEDETGPTFSQTIVYVQNWSEELKKLQSDTKTP
jgi:Tol biopolymer transport system component